MGWPVLRDFFGRIQQKLVVGMIDSTSAHVLAGLDSALSGGAGARDLSLVLDHPTRNPTADQSDEETEQDLSGKLGGAFSFAWGRCARAPRSASGSFRPPITSRSRSGTPDVLALQRQLEQLQPARHQSDGHAATRPRPRRATATGSRDRPSAAGTALRGLSPQRPGDRTPGPGPGDGGGRAGGVGRADLNLAELNPAAAARPPRQFFAPVTITEPMTVQPLLTPDRGADSGGMYAERMLPLISGAQRSLYIQLQYIHPSNQTEDAGFTALLDAVAARAGASGAISASSSASGRTANGWNGCRRPASTPGSSVSRTASTTRASLSIISGWSSAAKTGPVRAFCRTATPG